MNSRPRWTSWVFWGFVLVTYLYPLFLFPIHNPNEHARLYMTVAIWDHETFAIGNRVKGKNGRFKDEGSVYDRWGYVNDKALQCDDKSLSPPNCEGKLYSAKAPGTSFLGVPFYALLKTFADSMGVELPVEALLFYLRLMTVVLPTLLMIGWFRRFADDNDVDHVVTDWVSAGLAVGSMVYTYSHMFAGHQITSYLLFFAFLSAWKARDDDARIWPVLGGLTGAMAVVTEYPMALVAVAIFVLHLTLRPNLKTVGWYIAGGALPVLLAAWFHWSAFGNPLKTPYSTLENPQFVKDIAHGFMGLRESKMENIEGTFASARMGLFYFAPWLALVIPVLLAFFVSPLRKAFNKHQRKALGAALASTLLLTLFIACHSLWESGWTLGPRYIVPIVPFAALAILLGASKLATKYPTAVRWGLGLTVAVSIAVTGASSMVTQGFHMSFFNPLAEATVPLLKDGYFTYNLGHALGFHGWATMTPILLVTSLFLLTAFWRSKDPGANFAWRPFLLVLAILASTFWFKVLLVPDKPKSAFAQTKALAFTKTNFYPFDFRNADLEQRALLRDFEKIFPKAPQAKALQSARWVAEGRCGDSMNALSNYKKTAEEQWKYRSQTVLLGSTLPFPTLFPMPLLLQNDFYLSEHALKNVDRREEKRKKGRGLMSN